MTDSQRSHLRAALQALFVVFLWATSWVLIKIGLDDIPAITFAGLRYFAAFLCLLSVLLLSRQRPAPRAIPRHAWVRLFALGVLLYAVTQGASFVALAILPAVTVTLLWSFSSVTVALMSIFWLRERPSLAQWLGIGLTIFGTAMYLHPIALPALGYWPMVLPPSWGGT